MGIVPFLLEVMLAVLGAVLQCFLNSLFIFVLICNVLLSIPPVVGTMLWAFQVLNASL